MKQTTPVCIYLYLIEAGTYIIPSQPQQKRMVDDTERRLNSLFDALNCETLSPLVVQQLNGLTEGICLI